jgi:hypothetical protein
VARHRHKRIRLLAIVGGCAALAGCGAGAPRAGHVEAPRPLVSTTRAQRAATAQIGRADAPRFFSAASVWNRALASDAPLDPRSAELVAALGRQVVREQERGNGPWINTTSYGVPILTVSADQPTVAVQLDHAPDAALSSAWRTVPLPSAARSSAGSDGYLVVWQPSRDRMWEFWRLVRQGDGWHASWGGAIRHVSSSPGVFTADAWPGAKPWWGATASSLALAGGVMTIDELRRGRIEHALAIAVPDVRASVIAAPAQRTDGTSQDAGALPEGAHLRLDPRLDLGSLAMTPLARMMAEAAQRYGIVVRDFAGVVAFEGQDPTPTGGDPYRGPGGFFGGQQPNQALASFPWTHLQVLKMDLRPEP